MSTRYPQTLIWKGFLSLILLMLMSRAIAAVEETLAPIQIDPISQFILLPSREEYFRPSDLGLNFEEVRFANPSGAQLRGWFVQAEDAQHTVLVCMGNVGNISAMLFYAQFMAEQGFNVFMYDYQGFGGSEGMATVFSLYSDTLSAFDYLVDQRRIEPQQIGVFGVSLGSSLALALAAERPVGAVVVEDVLVPDLLLQEWQDRLPDTWVVKVGLEALKKTVIPRFDPLRNVARMQCPLFLLHGEKDRLLSPAGTLQVAAAATVPMQLWIIQGAGHAPETLEINDREYVTQISGFFKRAFAGTVTPVKPTFSCEPQEGKWVTKVALDCTVPGAWQVVSRYEDGHFSFSRYMVEDRLRFTEEAEAKVTHVSALRFHHTEELPHGAWRAQLSPLSQSRAEYRDFERRVDQHCAWKPQEVTRDGETTVTWRRNVQDVAWVLQQLPVPQQVHPHIAPRYSRFLAQFYEALDAEDQRSCQDLRAAVWSFMPEMPEHYYELDDARYQVRLVDYRLRSCLLDLARWQWTQGDIESVRKSLNMAQRVSFQKDLIRSLAVDEFEEGMDFDRFVERVR